jgi:hypothetical protein
MRNTLALTIIAALTLGVAASAFAQGETRSPPSPNAGNSAPTPPNSVPAGRLTADPSAPGGGSPTIGAQSRTTGMAKPTARRRTIHPAHYSKPHRRQTTPKPAQ